MKTFITLMLLLLSVQVNSQNFDIYVSDAGNFSSPPWQILKFDENGQNGTVFINTNLNWPQDILFLEDDNVVLVSNLGSGKISRHDATTGAFLSYFASAISGPTRMKIGLDGYLYVLQWNGNGKVRRYNLNGTFNDEFTDVGVPQSIGFDWDSNGNLYVSSYSGGYVRKFDASGADMGFFISSNLQGPTNIWFDTNGDLLVADYNGNSVKRFDPSGNYIEDYLTGLNQCEGVAIFPNGNILVGNGGSHSVKMYDSNGMYMQDLVSSGAVNLLNPNAVVLRPVTNVTVPELNFTQVAVLYPSIGNEFYISQEYAGKIKSISLYNSIGKNIVNENFQIKSKIFNAQDLADGVYVVRISLLNGKEVMQKVVVKND